LMFPNAPVFADGAQALSTVIKEEQPRCRGGHVNHKGCPRSETLKVPHFYRRRNQVFVIPQVVTILQRILLSHFCVCFSSCSSSCCCCFCNTIYFRIFVALEKSSNKRCFRIFLKSSEQNVP
jgi:hypothetical protein